MLMYSTARNIARLIRLYAESQSRKPTSVSLMVLGHQQALARLERGKNLTTDKADAALEWLDAHWPADTPWPEDIFRLSTLGAPK